MRIVLFFYRLSFGIESDQGNNLTVISLSFLGCLEVYRVSIVYMQMAFSYR